MRPILVNIPAKLLFLALLAVAAILFFRDLIVRRKDRAHPLSPTPLYLLVIAEGLLGFRSGTWTPGAAAFSHPWEAVHIYAYGVMLGTSLVVGWFLVMRLAQQDHLDQQDAGTIYMWSAVWSIIGSRLLWFIADTDHSVGSIFDILEIWQGGLVAYGGMISGFFASWYGCRKRGIPLLKWADVAAPAVVLGTGITRVGCLLFGCDYGKRADTLAWAIRFPKGSPAWHHHVEQLGLSQFAAQSFPVHPTQIYESLAGLFLFALLMLIRRYRKFSGEVFLGWVLGYGILRPLIEIYRDDEDRGVYQLPFTNQSFSTSQYIGGVSVILGLALLVILWRRYRRDPQSLRLWETPTVAPARAVERSAGPPPARRRKRR